MTIISLQIKSKASDELAAIAKKHIPFAVAKTLTQIAQQSQQEVRKNIREKFFIRKKSGGFESSIRIKPATKTKLTAEVYTFASFAALHKQAVLKKQKMDGLQSPLIKQLVK